jgi:chaperonin GroES
MAKQFTPFSDRILVRPVAESRKSGLIDPDAQKEKPLSGTVLSVGPAVEEQRIVPGAEVGWRKYAGVEIKVTGETLLLLREDEVDGSWEEA